MCNDRGMGHLPNQLSLARELIGQYANSSLEAPGEERRWFSALDNVPIRNQNWHIVKLGIKLRRWAEGRSYEDTPDSDLNGLSKEFKLEEVALGTLSTVINKAVLTSMFWVGKSFRTMSAQFYRSCMRRDKGYELMRQWSTDAIFEIAVHTVEDATLPGVFFEMGIAEVEVNVIDAHSFLPREDHDCKISKPKLSTFS